MSLSKEHTLTASEEKRLASARELSAAGAQGIAQLIDMLTDPSWVVRRSIVEALASIGAPAVEPLCESLRKRRDSEARIAATVDALVASRASVDVAVLRLAADPDPDIAADAAQILGRRRNPSATPVLVRLTRNESDNVAVAAIEGLGRIGGRAAIEALIEAARSGNFFRTFPAIDILGRSGDPRVVEPLAKLLKNPSYLPEAARALGRSGERAAVKPLIELLDSQSDVVVRVAASALWELRDRFEEKSGGGALVVDEMVRSQIGADKVRRLIRVMSNADIPEAGAICHLLGAVGNAEAAPMLAAKLDAAAPVAACAAAALKRICKDADEPLLKAIREGSSARRKVLLLVVSRSAAASAVASCLEDSDVEVRALVCDTLARLGNAVVVPELFPLLSDPNLRVVHSATAAIQALGSRESRELAIRAAKSESPVVRRSALRILAYFGHDSALQPMLDRLHDADPRVREAAIQGLPYLEDLRALEAIFETARSPIGRIRSLAMRSLGQVPNASERIYSVLLKGLNDPDAWVRYYACQSLGRLAFTPAVTEISKLLMDEAGQVRASAVEALSHLDSPEAHTILSEAARSSDPEVKRAALVGLGIARRVEDLPVILSAAGEPDSSTRLVALSALANFPSPLVLGALGSAASDSDEQVSSAAVGFLAGRPEEEATEILIELLSADSTAVRARSALLVPSEGRIAGILVALESANDERAPVLISILSKLDRPEARVALFAAMKSNNVPARKAVATVLAARRDPEMISTLQEAAENDPDPEVRQICSLLLRG